ncbi:MAG TPA: response regulator [Polyangiaceae bacterium]|jgi:FixJ family two-component response regulator
MMIESSSTVTVPGRFLVVEDDFHLAQTLARVLGAVRPTDFAGSIVQAKRQLDAHPRWTGLVVDIGLPDGSGLELVAHARTLFPLVPVMVLTGYRAAEAINRSHTLGAEFVCKPGNQEHINRFMHRAVAMERVSDERVTRVLEELARRCRLSPRETDLVAAAVSNASREELCQRLSVSPNTLKSRVRAVLRKTDHNTLDKLLKTVLQTAVVGSGLRSTPIREPSAPH